MMKVLLPTDFSPESRYALEYVLGLLQSIQQSAQVLLVNTYTVPSGAEPATLVSLNDDLKRRSRDLLKKEISWAQESNRNPLVTFKFASHMGTLNNVVLHLIREEKIDLVVMGKGSGNHVEQIAVLLRRQQCPLLITHRQESADSAPSGTEYYSPG